MQRSNACSHSAAMRLRLFSTRVYKHSAALRLELICALRSALCDLQRQGRGMLIEKISRIYSSSGGAASIIFQQSSGLQLGLIGPLNGQVVKS